MITIKGGKSGVLADVDSSNRLHTSAVVNSMNSNFFYEVAAGNIEGVSHINKFGAGTVGAKETIWDGSSIIASYTYMTTASTLYISSADAGDTQVYEVQGLDKDYKSQTVQVTAAGRTFVALNGLWMRVFRVKNLGTTDNAGIIYISDDNTDVGGDGVPDTLSNVKAMIIAGNNQTLMSIYTVAAGKTAYMVQWIGSTGKGDDAKFSLWVRPKDGVFQIKDQHQFFQSYVPRLFTPYLVIPEKYDIASMAAIGAGTGVVSTGFDLILVDN